MGKCTKIEKLILKKYGRVEITATIFNKNHKLLPRKVGRTEKTFVLYWVKNHCKGGLFSGDGTGCAARLLKKYGAQILGGVQIKMPDSVCDSKLLKKVWKKTGSAYPVVGAISRNPEQGVVLLDKK